MRGKSSRFLDRIQQDAALPERGAVLSAVRAVFYALFHSAGREEAEQLSALLPGEIESLWKPAYFQCLREDTEPAGFREAFDHARTDTPGIADGSVEALLAAVSTALRAELPADDWDRLSEHLPRELSAAGTEG